MADGRKDLNDLIEIVGYEHAEYEKTANGQSGGDHRPGLYHGYVDPCKKQDCQRKPEGLDRNFAHGHSPDSHALQEADRYHNEWMHVPSLVCSQCNLDRYKPYGCGSENGGDELVDGVLGYLYQQDKSDCR